MATLVSLGKTIVPVPGTPVRVVPPASIAPQSCHAFLVTALSENVGKIYIGEQGLSKTTLAKVYSVLPVPTTNSLPTFSVAVTDAANALGLDNLWIDADSANDGVLVSCVLC